MDVCRLHPQAHECQIVSSHVIWQIEVPAGHRGLVTIRGPLVHDGARRFDRAWDLPYGAMQERVGVFHVAGFIGELLQLLSGLIFAAKKHAIDSYFDASMGRIERKSERK